ncbi:helix-turn-helix transcriptional regulator [Paenibacillus sp. LjRoot56]|uniref:helix-turn-helix transcriptional regulator n=1 Tax=Paenibacillus sp. LjRoot56 TaxID=3342333 RepID=UPI003ED06ED6
MRSILQLKLNTRSILTKLLLSFLAIIVLFVSFNIVSLILFRKSIHDEIITYNDANLSHTAHSFEQYFQLLNNVIVSMYLDDHLRSLKGSDIDYVAAGQIMDDVRKTVNNQQLFLNNLFVYDVKHSLVLEQIRGSSLEVMFSEHYTNPKYTYPFWKKEFTEPFSTQLYPAAAFTSSQTLPISQTGLVIPYVVKSKLYPEFIMLAFIDVQKLYKAYHQSINDNFYILSPQGVPLYSSDQTDKRKLPALKSENGWVKSEGSYYFYEKGELSGLTYINIVPDASISARIVRLNVILVVLLVVSIAISVMVSIFFSRRFNNPVKKIVESIRHLNEKKDSDQRGTNEFEFINENIGRMLRANQKVLSDLEEKKSLLHSYTLVSRLKRIRVGHHETLEGIEPDERPFRFVLFQLAFKARFREELLGEEERATSFIHEYVSRAISAEMKGSQTIQIEADQILSLVYLDEDDTRVTVLLDKIKTELAADSQYCFFTITVSSRHDHASQMTAAYEEVVQLIKLRPFDDETCVLEAGQVQEKYFLPTAALEHEFNVNLQEGNDALAMQSLRRILAQMKKKGIGTARFHRYAEETTDKVIRMLHMSDNEDLYGLADLIPTIHTVEQLEQYFETLVKEAARLVRLKKEERDPIVSFVFTYTEEHYAEDISLEQVAGKLNITGGYLSTYFKEKTGMNFVDYINEFRIKQAMNLLQQSEMKIQDIAIATGFQSLSSFNRTFKKFSGVTPSEYRRL